MKDSSLRKAALLALAAAAISGFSNFVAKIGVSASPDPIFFTTLKNSLVATMLFGLLLAMKKGGEIRQLNKGQWLKLIVIGVVGGALPFALFFTGLAQTSAVNANLIHKTLFLWVLLLAMPALKERVTGFQLLGFGALLFANLLVGGFTGFKFNTGELMILLATLLWAVENLFAKKILADISSWTAVSFRMIVGSTVLLLVVAFQGHLELFTRLSAPEWNWTLLSSILLLGYVSCWYAALKRAPATYVAALLVPATLVTNVLSAVFLTHKLDGVMVLSSLLFIAGASMIVFFGKKTSEIQRQVLSHNS
jgi:drug/metabolite transporter (DMT)-like permease